MALDVPLRLTVFATHVIQYQAPLFAELARSPRLNLLVVFFDDAGARPYFDSQFGRQLRWDIDLLSGYESQFLRKGWRRLPNLVREVRRCDVAVVHGHSRPSMLLTALLCRLFGTPFLLRGEAWAEANVGGWRRRLRDLIAFSVVRSAAGGIANGQKNREFYTRFGAKLIVMAPYSVDVQRFRRLNGILGEQARAQQLRQLGLDPELPTLLFAGKLISKKRPQDLIAAARLMGREANVVFVGDGALLEALKKDADGLRAAFLGFVNQEQMPAALQLGDVFVLPSSLEPWGLVVNEALASGLLPVVSDRVGCADDLVAGIGEVFPSGDVVALADALERALDQPRDANWHGAVADRLEAFAIKRTADGFAEAAQAARVQHDR